MTRLLVLEHLEQALSICDSQLGAKWSYIQSHTRPLAKKGGYLRLPSHRWVQYRGHWVIKRWGLLLEYKCLSSSSIEFHAPTPLATKLSSALLITPPIIMVSKFAIKLSKLQIYSNRSGDPGMEWIEMSFPHWVPTKVTSRKWNKTICLFPSFSCAGGWWSVGWVGYPP